MRKILLLFCFAVLVIGFVCRPVFSLPRGVVFAIDKDFPPFTYLENGNPAGFDVDIVKAIFEKTEIMLTIKLMTWEQALSDLTIRKVHLVSGVDKSREREKLFIFCKSPLIYDRGVIISKGNINSPADLKCKRVATLKCSIYVSYIDKIKGIKLDLYATEGEALGALVSGRVDAFVGTERTALYNIKKHGYKGLKMAGKPIKQSPLYIAVRSTDKDLAVLIDKRQSEIVRDGTYKKIYTKWFGK